jgi:O-antigen/teichoic acid export membrane protein
MIGAPFAGALWISWFALFAYGRERDVLWVALLGAVIAVGVGVLVIPAEGAMGAAWVYVGVLALMASCTVAMFEREVRTRAAAIETPAAA